LFGHKNGGALQLATKMLVAFMVVQSWFASMTGLGWLANCCFQGNLAVEVHR
jgi:hypothetical protein